MPEIKECQDNLSALVENIQILEQLEKVEKTEKYCNKCKEVKPIGDFHKCRSKYDGLHSTCKECRKKISAEYYENNKNVIAERSKEYRENNRDAATEYSKEYRKNNKDVIAERKKEYDKNNKNAILERKKEYYKKNKDVITERKKEYNNSPAGFLTTLNRAIIKKNKKIAKYNKKHPEIKNLLYKQTINLWFIEPRFNNCNCTYCGEKVPKLALDRINSNIGYEPHNIIPCCRGDNSGKNNLSPQAYIELCKRIDQYFKPNLLLVQKNKALENYQNKSYHKKTNDRYRQLKGGAKKRGLIFNLSKIFVNAFWDAGCSYCGQKLKQPSFDRIDSSIRSYDEDNVIPCCWDCNRIKGEDELEVFLARVSRVASKSVEEHLANIERIIKEQVAEYSQHLSTLTQPPQDPK